MTDLSPQSRNVRTPGAVQIGETLLRTLLESAPDAAILVDRDGVVAFANSQAEQVFGYSREQLVGQPADMLLPPRLHGFFSRPVDAPKVHAKANSGEVWELAGLRAGGAEFPAEARVSSLIDAAAGLRLTMIRDNSEPQQAAREQQRRSRQQAAIAAFGRRAIGQLDLADLVNQATTCVAETLDVSYCLALAVAHDQTVLHCRSISFSSSVPAAARSDYDRAQPVHLASLSGYAFRVGQPVLYRRSDRSSLFDTTLLEKLHVGSAVAVPVKFRDRSWGTLTAYSEPERDFSIADVQFLEAVASVLSVALERQQAEDSVRRDRDFAESLIETAQAIVLVLDPQGRIVRFNAYAEQLIGYPLEQVQGIDWAALALAPANRERGRDFFLAASVRDPLTTAMHPVVGRDGVPYDIQWTGRALSDASGAVTGLLFTGHDLTELRRAQQQLLESERLAAIGQMASGLAHESRNALQQIGACAEMLTMELTGQREALDLVDGIHEAEARLHSLFEDVRAYAVPLRLKPSSTELPALWQAAWNELIAQRKLATAKLVEHHPGVDVWCEVDGASLQRALYNILENALDASGANAQIEIRCRETHIEGRPALSVDIRDNGPGLSSEQMRRIFEPFFTTKTKGTGLGMSIARRVIAAHGGRLEAGSATPGGAEIRVTLPRRAVAVPG
jgi:two-component system, LuxR family, sensor kinase FixL